MPLMIGCPKVGGAGLGLGAAKLAIASKTPTEQRVKATKARGLKRPDCEEGFFFMRFSFVKLQRRLSLTIRKLRSDRMLFSHITQNQRGNLRLNNVSSEFQPPDTWLLSMRGSTNYCPKSNCQRARCRWHRHVQRRKRALRLNRSRKCGCGYRHAEERRGDDNFRRKSRLRELRSTTAGRSSTSQTAHQTTSPSSISNRARN